MTPEQIISTYDRRPDLTMNQLSRMSGWSVSELTTLLLEA